MKLEYLIIPLVFLMILGGVASYEADRREHIETMRKLQSIEADLIVIQANLTKMRADAEAGEYCKIEYRQYRSYSWNPLLAQ